MLFAVRKDYDYVKGNLGKIKAAVADIGWFLTQQIYSQSMSREVTKSLTVNDFRSGQKFLEQFLEDASNQSWFNDIEPFVSAHESPVGTLCKVFAELSQSHLLFEKDAYLKNRDLCIEVSLLCAFLEEKIRDAVEETKQPLLRLL